MMRRIFRFGSAVAMALGVVAMSVPANAGVIVWQPSVSLFSGGNNDAFVSTNGTSVLAFNGGIAGNIPNNPTVLNGVGFTSLDAAGLAAGLTGVGGVGVRTDTLSNQAGPTTFGDGEFSGNLDIFNVLAGAVFDGGNATAGQNAIEFTGLTPGNTYEIQVFVNDARGGTNAGTRDTEWEVGFTDGSGNGLIAGEADLTNRPFNNGTDPNLAGDYIIGTFVANSATEGFNIAGTRGGLSIGDDISDANTNNGQAQINGLQLREIAVIPEPSSLALLGLMGLGMVTVRRRK